MLSLLPLAYASSTSLLEASSASDISSTRFTASCINHNFILFEKIVEVTVGSASNINKRKAVVQIYLIVHNIPETITGND